MEGIAKGHHIICVDCAERDQILPKVELDAIVAKAHVHKAEVEALIKYGN